MCVIVLVVKIDVAVSVNTEIIQRLIVAAVNIDKISISPDFNAHQHQVDAFWVIQL